MTAPKLRYLPDILEEHVEELAFLWGQRRTAIRSPIYTRRALLQLEDVHSYYGDSHILHGVSLAVSPGRVLTLLGRNGAGKTTTMHAIMGMVSVTAGRISFGGEIILGEPPYRIARRGIGLVPENRRMFASLTVRENLGFPLKVARKADAST